MLHLLHFKNSVSTLKNSISYITVSVYFYFSFVTETVLWIWIYLYIIWSEFHIHFPSTIHTWLLLPNPNIGHTKLLIHHWTTELSQHFFFQQFISHCIYALKPCHLCVGTILSLCQPDSVSHKPTNLFGEWIILLVVLFSYLTRPSSHWA